MVIRDYDAAFERYDVLVSPTSPTTAFAIGEKADDPMAMYLNDIFTIPANLAGVPAISVPCGLDDAGLPVGIQLTAPALDEARLFTRGRRARVRISAWTSGRRSSPASSFGRRRRVAAPSRRRTRSSRRSPGRGAPRPPSAA